MKSHKQNTLFPELFRDQELARKPVNVAAVPQRSPFRYPGGKTWFVPVFRKWLASKSQKPEFLVEPFAGGGIISLTALFENFVTKVVMVEIDDVVAAVWQSIIEGHSGWIAKQILNFDLSHESVLQEISRAEVSLKEKAFQTILKNRTLHGGIMAEGSGFIKYGENGKGIRSRWYPETLARRFNNIQLFADRMIFRQEDGLKVIQEFSQRTDCIFFIDPPYTAGGKKAGKRLYRHCDIDHNLLFSICETIKSDFLMTYDNADEVKMLAKQHGFQMRLVPMTNTHHTTMEELVIGKDLTWLDNYPSVHEPESQYQVNQKKS